MAEEQTTDPWEGKDVLIFRVGEFKGVKYDDAAFDSIVENTKKRGVDIPWAPDEDAAQVEHSLKNRAHGYIPLSETYIKMGKFGKEFRGKLRGLSKWMKEQLADKAWRYVSPAIAGYKTMKDVVENPGLGYIRADSPTNNPAMSPQEALMSEGGGFEAQVSLENWYEPEKIEITSGQATVTLSGGKFKMDWVGTSESAAQMLAKKAKLWTGKRFAALKKKLGKKPRIYSPGGLAAEIGRKKFGKARFQKMAARARRKKKRS